MSLAKLFYMKETFRESARRWRQACFRRRSTSLICPDVSRFTFHASRFLLEALEPRVLLSATPTEAVANQALEPSAIIVPAGSLPSLDVDLNDQADALSDGILIIRHLFGFTGTDLTNGVVDPTGRRTDPAAISAYLESIRTTALDVDLNQTADALSDGILIIRSLFGFTGTDLTNGVVDPGGGRIDPTEIATFLDNMNPQRELIAPLVTAGLQQDTGISATDSITLDPTITGTIADINQIAAFTAGFDAAPVGNFVGVLADLQTTGVFTLSTARLVQITGGTLADGTHTLHLRATDARGNVATIDRVFTLDTLAPASPIFDLALTSDTGVIGDQQTTAGLVTLKGQTDPNVQTQLLQTGAQAAVTGTGTFQLPDVTLTLGANPFSIRASDVAGNTSEFSQTFTRIVGAQTDVVLTWNQLLLDAIKADATNPPMASRAMAMESLAVYDTINALEGTPGYYVTRAATPGTSIDAAVASAAHDILAYLYPAQQATFDAALTAILNQVPDGAGETNGINLGQSIAADIIAIRNADGWDDFVDYVPGNQPGDWQLTAPMFDVALLPQWADLTPFAMTSPDQFSPAGPPDLTSQAYADAFNDVKALGSATGSARTADQTQIARFWADGPGTYTPPGHWNQIATQVALQLGLSSSSNARLLAQLNVALADAAITSWNTKYQYEFWRPITAIQQADVDGNAATAPDTTWTSLLITPPFPEYTSGHSTFSGAAAEILTAILGGQTGFTTHSIGLPNVERTFTSFEQAAQEAGRSRIYGGIHFEFSNQDGLASGKSLAQYVLNRFTVTADTQAPTILLDQVNETATNTNLTITGRVLDNLSGVAALQVKLDNGIFAPVAFSPTGTFSFTTTLALDGTADGAHTLTFQATDNQGNSSTVAFAFTLDTQVPQFSLTSPAEAEVLTVASRLTGIADATGSTLIELCYKFDNGTLVPVSFDPVSGSFDELLDLSKLAVGAHTLSLRAQDAAGNVTTTTLNVTLAAPIPLAITAVTPQPGSSDVGSTFRPQVFFSRPINLASLTNNNFFATDSTGTKLAATIVPSQDGTFAWLFFTSPMPGASTITIHVDGATILAAGDGQALDADADGFAGGSFTSTFSTVSLVPLEGTTLSGKVLDPGPDLKMMTFDDIRAGADGILHTNDDVFLNPIAGAKVFIVGLENQDVFTDAQGNFSFSAVPSGDIKLAIDGRTATNAPAGIFFPEMVMDLQIEVGQANTVMGTMGTREDKAANLTRPEVYLPRLQTSILQTVSTTGPTLIQAIAEGAPNLTEEQRQLLTLTVQPGSLIGFDGQAITNGQVGISTVPPELVRDMLPNGLMQLAATLTIQAPGVAKFTIPVAFTFPNLYGAAPGRQVNFYSFDHDTGLLVIEGTATVSPDGKFISSDPGTGITKPGWHGPTPPGDQHEEKVERLGPCGTAADQTFGNAINQTSAAVLTGISALLGTLDLVPWDLIPGIGWIADASIGLGSVLAGALADEIASGQISDGTGKQAGLAIVSAGTGWIPGVGWLPSTTADIESWEIGVNSFRNQYQAAESSMGTLFGQIEDCLQASLVPFSESLQIEAEGQDIVTSFSQTIASLDARLTQSILLKNAIMAVGDVLGANPSGPISDPALLQILSDAVTTLSAGVSFFSDLGFSSPRQSTASLRPAVQTVKTEIVNQLRSVSEPAEGIHYKISVGNGVNIEGVTDRSGRWRALLGENRTFTVSYFDPITNFAWTEQIKTGRSGSQTQSQRIVFSQGGPDADGDGITDIGEAALGTNAGESDTDEDGLSDLAEVKQGLNPLGATNVGTGLLSSLPLAGEAKEVVLEGSLLSDDQQTAYVATGSYGLAVVDASQFKKPIVFSQLDLPGDATDVSVDSQLGIAMVASNAGGLHFIDVSNPTSPVFIRTIATTPSQVEVFDGFAYVAVNGELRSYNLLTGEFVQSVSVSTDSIVGLAREGNTLYTTDSTNTIRVTTFSVGALTPRGSLTIPLDFGQPAGKVFVGNGVAYIGAEGTFTGGFATVDVSNPDTLALLSGIDANNIEGRAVVANGSGLGIAVGNVRGPQGPIAALDVLSLSDPTNTGAFLTRFALPAAPHSVAIGAGIAFVADGTSGLQVVNYRSFDNQGQAPVVSITSSLIDLDPGTSGVQVTEGGTIPIRLTATDDVQVRNVELLVNGVVVSNDVSFPFELSAVALGSTLTPTTTTVQVRATDTGGNIGLSNLLTFQLVADTFSPTLVSSNVTAGAILDRTLRTIRLDFSEPLDPNTVTAQNFQLLGPNGLVVTPTAIQLSNDDTIVRLTYNPLALGAHQLVIKSAAVTDRVGNPFDSQDLVTPFEIISTVLSSLDPLPPLGSRIYVRGISGQIDTSFGSESFTISLDAGQLVTMGVSPDSALLRTRIDLLDSTGAVLGSAEASEVGAGVTLQAVSVPTTGIYTLRVQSLSGTGSFIGALYLNALEESEFFGGPTNDTLATATDLSPTSLPLQGAADRIAVTGYASGGDDFYRVDLTQGQVLEAVLQAFGGGDIGLDLRDSAGTVLALGQGNLQNAISKGILGFVVPTTGAYYLNVTGLPNPDPLTGFPQYSLVVTRGSAFEAFPNDSLATAEGLGLTGQIMGSVGTRVIPQIGLTIPDPADFFFFTSNLGDVLTITTATPGDGIGEPANTLDPALQLFDPAGLLIASNNNGAADGRNAVIVATVTTTGSYKIGVLSTVGGGDYSVRVIVTDTFSPLLLSSTVFVGAIFDQTLSTISLEFSEPLNASTVTAQNFQLLGPNGLAVTPTTIQLGNNDALVQLTYSPLALGAHQLVIKSAAVTDRVGNPFGSQDLVTPFQIFSAVVPPMDFLVPVGSQVYAQFVGGQIDVPFASKSFTVLLDGGQNLTVGMSPQGSPTLRLRIELLDSTGALLRAAEAPVSGVGLGLDAVPIQTTGVYTLRVQSLAGTGSFGGPLYLNAVEEIEIFGGPTNDTLVTAIELSPTSVPLQGAADRLAVTGYASGGDDFYRVDLTQGQVIEAVLQPFMQGGTIGLDLRNSSGTVVAVGENLNDFYQGIQGFVAPTTGAYYLNVSGVANSVPASGLPQYNMVVTRNATFEVAFNDTLNTAEDIALTGQAMGSVGTRAIPQIGLTLPDPGDFYFFVANAGDVLTITTTTPGDGIGEPANTLDPALQLFDPTGTLIAFNLNGAVDGRNAVITATVTATGSYKIAVLPTAGAGDYTVRVSGATGIASASTSDTETIAADVSVSSTSTSSSSFNGSLAYVQRSWVKGFVTTAAAESLDEGEELLIALPAGG